jgi:hypothetical protein
MVHVFALIGADGFELKIIMAKALLYDKHDAIHKAACWMPQETSRRALIMFGTITCKSFA